jgi:hypothetical protein
MRIEKDAAEVLDNYGISHETSPPPIGINVYPQMLIVKTRVAT